jgi:uncharacterized protein YgiM (DUF1202 family)
MEKNKKIILGIVIAVIAVVVIFNVISSMMPMTIDETNDLLIEEKFEIGKYFDYVSDTNGLNEVKLKAWMSDYLQEVNSEYGTNYTVYSIDETNNYWQITVENFSYFIINKNTGEIRILDYAKEQERNKEFNEYMKNDSIITDFESNKSGVPDLYEELDKRNQNG